MAHLIDISASPVSATMFLLLVVCCSQAMGDLLHITHAPGYMKFVQHPIKDLPASDIPKMISHSLGLPSGEMSWNGMLQGSLFKRPKANVIVTLVGHDDMDKTPLNPKSLAKYIVHNDVPFVDIEQVTHNFKRTLFGSTPLMVELLADNANIDVKSWHEIFKKLPSTRQKLNDRLLENNSVLNQFDIGTLNISHSADAALLEELQMIRNIMEKLKSNPGYLKSKTPDFYSFTISGLKDVAQHHGGESSQVASATKLLNEFIDKMTSEFRQLYKDGVMVEVLVTKPIHGVLVRKARSLMEADTQNTATVSQVSAWKKANIAASYGDEYPAIFNIILWGMIILAVALFIISHGIWNMDPGRDSVIYRMTSQRLKKE